MSKDNNDDPFAPPRDATIFRPRPGAGKRGPDQPAPGPAPANQGGVLNQLQGGPQVPQSK